jgi:MmyB-like transcription regulator ligand binding domain
MADQVHQVGGILAVVDRELGIKPDLVGVVAQQARADAVKRAGPGQCIRHDAGIVAHHLAGDAFDPLRHLGCRSAREGHQQDAARIGAIDDEVSQHQSDLVRVARTRARRRALGRRARSDRPRPDADGCRTRAPVPYRTRPRPPDARYPKNEGVTPRLQRVLDALDPSPAVIRTATWDVVAWNRAATAMLMDYGSLPPEQRNILRFVFLDPRARAVHYDWESVARLVLGAFRLDAVRAGAADDVEALVDELCRRSPEFKVMWRDNDVHGGHGETVNHLK